MKKRICFFCGDITRSGGTERVSTHLANALAKEGEYEICFLSLVEQANAPFYPLDSTIARYCLADRWIRPGPGYLPLIRKLRRFLKEHRIDLILDIDIVLDVLSIPASRGLETKVLSWEHFHAEFEMSVPYRKWILWYSVRHSDYVVVLTKGDLADYAKYFGRKDRICAIYNAVDVPKEHGHSERKRQILTLGRLVPEKGMDQLMQVAKTVLSVHDDWQWLLLGEGPERQKLEQFILDNNLQNRLILMGNVGDVYACLREGSILVCTSQFEGLGMCLLEARSMMVPCVSFAVKSGPVEIIRDGVDGYLVTPFDCHEMAEKINKLIENPSLREQFAQKALQSIGEFETKTVMQQWKCVLKQLTQK